MVTLTFDGTAVQWTGAECQRAFNAFMTRFKRAYWCRDYLVAREVQERGVYHYHMIVLDVDFLPFAEVSAMWGNGFVWITAFDSPARALSYAMKYVDKGGRLHASYHLIGALGVRDVVLSMRAFFSGVWHLHEQLVTYRISHEEYQKGILALAECG